MLPYIHYEADKKDTHRYALVIDFDDDMLIGLGQTENGNGNYNSPLLNFDLTMVPATNNALPQGVYTNEVRVYPHNKFDPDAINTEKYGLPGVNPATASGAPDSNFEPNEPYAYDLETVYIADRYYNRSVKTVTERRGKGPDQDLTDNTVNSDDKKAVDEGGRQILLANEAA